ncbi:uncharacterized protein EMH_0038950 [Eimeria mitis]|uniref:Uncharacterized protein n=1 Tax=Eimeria mitis TaxID=44415 RepID=U6JRY6_9EIME|nr:uncharacterized protein EMH_0038950 [Eimeria mitis]CDJ28225.1 hypothetical protein EMH_0038950 [Eimeria mitis]
MIGVGGAPIAAAAAPVSSCELADGEGAPGGPPTEMHTVPWVAGTAGGPARGGPAVRALGGPGGLPSPPGGALNLTERIGVGGAPIAAAAAPVSSCELVDGEGAPGGPPIETHTVPWVAGTAGGPARGGPAVRALSGGPAAATAATAAVTAAAAAAAAAPAAEKKGVGLLWGGPPLEQQTPADAAAASTPRAGVLLGVA